MACVTLKRSYQLDGIGGHSPSPSKRRRLGLSPLGGPCREMPPSPFAAASRFRHEDLLAQLPSQARRIQKRRLNYSISDPPLHQASVGSSIDPIQLQGSTSPTKNERHLFTHNEVKLICQRMMKEQEEKLIEIYDKILNEKLAEQYDQFVKFTHDQLQKNFDTAPSYLS